MKKMRNVAYFSITLTCLLLAGAANGLMDALAFHDIGKRFSNRTFWGSPAETWANKWAIGSAGEILVGKERYFLSSTFLSFTTDGWHLAKGCMLLFFLLAIVFATFIDLPSHANKLFYSTLGIIVAYLCFVIGFHIVY